MSCSHTKIVEKAFFQQMISNATIDVRDVGYKYHAEAFSKIELAQCARKGLFTSFCLNLGGGLVYFSTSIGVAIRIQIIVSLSRRESWNVIFEKTESILSA